MYIYIYMAIFLATCSLLSLLGRPYSNSLLSKSIFFLLVLLLILFAGFRHVGVGADDWNYVDKFLEVPNVIEWITGKYVYSFSKVWMEPGYVLIGSIVKVFTYNYTFLFLTIASISIGVASYCYYKYSPYYFLSLLLFFVHTFLYRDINQIRAAVAAAIGLLIVEKIAEKKNIGFFGIVALSVSFHMAALSYLGVYLCSFLKVTKKKVFIGLLISLFLGWSRITAFLLSFLPNMGYITTKIDGYSQSQYVDTTSLFDVTNIKNILLLLLLIFLWDKVKDKVKYFEPLALMFSLSVFWRLSFSDFGIFAARIATFYGVTEVIIIPSLLLAFKRKLIPCIFVLLYAFITLYLNLFVKEGRFPYELAF